MVTVEQGLGLGWAKKSGGSGLRGGGVLWYQSESGAQRQLGPLRAALASQQLQPLGVDPQPRALILQTAPSAGVSIAED